MKQYKDLTQEQQAIADKIEINFIKSASMTKHDFIMALAFVLNKYKRE